MVASAVSVLLLRDPAPMFVHDAWRYWTGAQAVATGSDAYAIGGLDLRGVLTALVYLPAYAVAAAFGGSMAAAGWAVLVQNALIIGAIGALVMPMLLGRMGKVRPVHVALASTLTVLALSGFAPYPLMDLPAVALALLAVLLLWSSSPWWLLAGGAALAGAVNLRPSYVFAMLMVLVVVVASRWRRAHLPLLGAAVVLGVQTTYGWLNAGVLSAWPPATATVSDIQIRYASYGVRYDTVAYSAGDARLWHCSPAMAERVGADLPASTGALFATLVDTLPTSALFALHKLSGSLLWSRATPYANPGEHSLHPLGLVVIVLVCGGVIALGAGMRAHRQGRTTAAMLLILALGTAVTLVGSAPEARFALPIVVTGIAGAVLATMHWHRAVGSVKVVAAWYVVALVLASATTVLGWHGLRHAAPPGDVTVEICRAS